MSRKGGVQKVRGGRGGVGQPEMNRRLRLGKGGGGAAMVGGDNIKPLQKRRFATVRQVNGGLQAQENDDLAAASRRDAAARLQAVDDDDLGQ
jgi:hypothetical protein